MEINIKKTDENPYLQRKEVHGTVTFTGATPAQKQLADALATKLNVKADAIFVNHVFTSFGSQAAAFEAHLYPSKEQLDKVVRLGKKAKEKLAKAAGTPAPAAVAADQPAKPALPAAAQAEAPKAEAKAEPKKEEVKPAEAKSEPKKEEPKKAEAKVEHKKEEPKKAEA